MRKVICCELAFLNKPVLEPDQSCRYVPPEFFSSTLGVWKNRFAQCDVNLRPPPWEPVAAIVEALAAEDHDRHNGTARLGGY
jgi:hypothetical protein